VIRCYRERWPGDSDTCGARRRGNWRCVSLAGFAAFYSPIEVPVLNTRLLAKRALSPLRILPVNTHLNRPLSSWSRLFGVIHDISVPRGVRAKSTPTPLCPANINIILALLDRTTKVPGDLAECGVFRGASLVPTAIYVQQKKIPKHIFGFDSFQGFDAVVNKDITLGGTRDPFRRLGGFSETSEALVLGKLQRFKVAQVVTLVPGYFRDSLQKCAECRFSFVHLDCDTYDSYSECLRFFYSRVNVGGIILFDEYNDLAWPGCNMAVDEFLADKPEKPQLITKDNYEKFYIEKA
jgi:O-methyltransferase